MLLDRFGQLNKLRKKVKRNFGTSKFECFEGLLRDVLRTSWGCPDSTSQGCPSNVRLGLSLDVISGRPQDTRLGSYCDKIYDKIKYLISQESGITDSINQN